MAHFHGSIAGVHLHGNGESQAAGGPADPSSVTGTPTSGAMATTTWAHSGGGETGFLVEINEAGAGWATAGTVGAGVYTYSHTGLTAATSYVSRVTALGTPNSAAVESAAWMTDTIGSGGGVVANDAAGTLSGAGAATVGVARRFRAHATTGSMAGGGAAVAGAATRARSHASSGALAGSGAVVAGAAEIVLSGVHTTAGVLAGAGAVVAGVAVRRARHVTTGAMAGAGGRVVGVSASPADTRILSAPPSGHGPGQSRRGLVVSTGSRSSYSTRTR